MTLRNALLVLAIIFAIVFITFLFFAIFLLSTWAIHLFCSKQPKAFYDVNTRVIVGMSTLPDNMEYLESSVRSLLSQTYPVDMVVVSIPYESARLGTVYDDTKIPDSLYAIPRVHVQRTPDYGPATKFMGIAQYMESNNFADKNNWIIVWCDDDILYNRHMVETFVHKLQMYQGAVIGIHGTRKDESHVPPFDNFDVQNLWILEAFCGIACRYGDFMKCDPFTKFKPQTPDSYSNLSQMEKNQFHSDDYMVSYHLRQSGANLIRVWSPVCNLYPFGNKRLPQSYFSHSLHKIQNHWAVYHTLREHFNDYDDGDGDCACSSRSKKK